MPSPTHWIDTNVMLEVYSHGDLFDEWEKQQRGEPSDVEGRRMRMQGSLWMAMALCKLGALTVSYQHENLTNILRMAPPGSNRGVWTSGIVYVLGDGGVFDGWDRNVTNAGAGLSNRDRDRLMVSECKVGGMVLVTRDAQVIKEAVIVGVDAAEPEPFAGRTLTLEDARDMFMTRMDRATAAYVAKTPTENRLAMEAAMTALTELYQYIWSPAGQVSPPPSPPTAAP